MEPTVKQVDTFEQVLANLQYVLIVASSSDEPMRLNWRHFDIMALVKERGSLEPSAISKIVGLSRPTTSKYLKYLQDNKLLTPRKGNEDKRSHTVILTSEADRILESIYAGQRQNARDALKELTPEEAYQFTSIAPKIIKALDSDTLHVI